MKFFPPASPIAISAFWRRTCRRSVTRPIRLKEIPDAPPAPQAVSGETLENQFYRIVLDAESGAVKSIFDKELNKELVNASSPYRFDQYLYVTGGDQSPNRLLEYSATWPIPELTIHNASGGRVVSVTNEPFGVAARLESSGVNTPKIETEVILFDGQKKIEFINRVHKTEVYSKEAIYFAFPLAMDQPQFRYEIQNGFVNPAHDLMPGAGREWFSVQHWVAADQDGVTRSHNSRGRVPRYPGRHHAGDLAARVWPTSGHDLFAGHEQLLLHQLRGRPGGRFHFPLRADERQPTLTLHT